jgi:acetyl esterase/lipase/lysophospholipase L1-like esterase
VRAGCAQFRGTAVVARIACALIACGFVANAPSAAAKKNATPIRVILVGDSTMARNSGYGDELCAWFKPEVTCVNVAKGGRSSRTYREEGSWAKVLEMLADKQSFDASYVLIQFGHNDQPGRPERSTTLPQFTENLGQYVKDVRDAGGVPVLVTPLTRRQFKDGELLEDLAPWADATRQVAKASHVALLDLNRDSGKAVRKLGPSKSAELAQSPPSAEVARSFETGTTVEANPVPADPKALRAPPIAFDYTHLGTRGGEFFAALVVKEIRGAVRPLASHLASKAPPSRVNAPHEYHVWRGAPPGAEGVTVKQSVIERSTSPSFHDRALINITTPTVTIYKPEKPDGSAVLIIPGGAYLRVVIDKEGEDTARRLNAHGITAAVLVYRLPGDGWAAGRDAPLQDAQRAMRLLRSGIAGALDNSRIGVLGFSAGGDLAAALSLRHDAKLYEPFDQADVLSARPDFTVLMYAAVDMPLRMPNGAPPIEPSVRLETLVNSATPPTFIVHAADDPAVDVSKSLQMFATLKAAKVPAEMHIFEEGGHGFGVRQAAGKPAEAWPELLVRWGVQHRFFTDVPQPAAKK